MIAISIDTEWSPDELIIDALQLLKEYKVNATFFATNKVRIRNHEIGLHPNFVSVDTYEATLVDLLRVFPHAIGIRNHRLLCDERLLPIYRKHGLFYESGYQMMGVQKIQPFYMECGIMQIPLYYMDRLHVEEPFFGRTFTTSDIDLSTDGVKVFDFHPIHLFLNTRKISTYAKAKQFYKNPDKLKQFVNRDQRGTRNFFIDLLDAIERLKIRTFLVKDIYRRFKKSRKMH